MTKLDENASTNHEINEIRNRSVISKKKKKEIGRSESMKLDGVVKLIN